MMSAEIASLEEVKRALAALRQAGVKVTATKVIEHIGGGSKSTILAHMRTLRNGADDAEEVPAAVIAMARPMLSNIYEAGRRAEAEKLRAWSERMSIVMEEQDAQIQELVEECSRLDGVAADLGKQLKRTTTENGILQGRVQEAQAAAAELDRQLSAERGRAAASLQDALARIERLVDRNPQRRTSGHKSERRTISLPKRPD